MQPHPAPSPHPLHAAAHDRETDAGPRVRLHPVQPLEPGLEDVGLGDQLDPRLWDHVGDPDRVPVGAVVPALGPVQAPAQGRVAGVGMSVS